MGYVEIARRAIAKNKKRELSETGEERSADGLNSPSSLNSQLSVSDINIDNPDTWPAYMIHLYTESLAEGGEDLARRQVEAEIAFWNGDTTGEWMLCLDRAKDELT